MLKILSKKFPNDDFPPIIVHLFYLLMSVTFCLLYKHIIIGNGDIRYNDYGGIYKALEGNSIKAIQFRVLVPLIFKAFTYLHIPDMAILMVIFIVFSYLTIIFFYRILNIYFQDKTFNSFIALALFYPMIWNFMLLNSIYFFIDHSLMFFMTACLYFVLAKKNNWLVITFLLGTLNHPSIGFIVLTFLLFNYNKLLKKSTVFYAILLVAVFISCLYVLGLVYPNFSETRDLTVVSFFQEQPLDELKGLPFHLLVRDLVLNFGGIHLFLILFLISGLWRKIKTEYVMIFLTIVPYLIMAAFRIIVRMEEMRNWIPIIPFVMIPALLYLSQIKNPLFRLSDKLSRESIS